MAFFQKQKESVREVAIAQSNGAKKENTLAQDAAPLNVVTRAHDRMAEILRNPRITEKATDFGGQSAYVFDVSPRANKRSIIAAVKRTYNVSPRAVRVLQVPRKTRKNVRTGKPGVTARGKKAYVYLTSGESITIS